MASLAVVLTGCSEDEAGPLSEDQLPGEVVESESSRRGTPTATRCPDLNQAQQHLAISRSSTIDDDYRYWTYRLDDGTWIAVTVIESGHRLDDLDRNLAEVTAAIDSCGEQEHVGTVEHLPDAAEGSVGYRSTMTDSNGTSEGETVIARAGDRVVMIVATHDQSSEPSVDVRDLLADVRDVAADLDLG